MERHQNLQAIVLNRKSWNDQDLWVQLLSSKGERVECIAKGAASPTSRRKAHLDPLSLGQFTLYNSGKNLYLQSAQIEESFTCLKENLDLSLEAQSLLFIVEKILPSEDACHEEIFISVLQALRDYNQKETSPLIWEKCMTQIAHQMGFLPSFKECSQCHQNILEDTAKWHSENQTLYCQNCSPAGTDDLPLKYRKALEFLKRPSQKPEIQLFLQPEEKQTLRRFLPQFFGGYLPDSVMQLL